jgi:hypothetical protein
MLECPKCGSRFLRPSRSRNVKEKLGKLQFVSPMRCNDCKTRFLSRTFDWSELTFARCPGCFRMDLSVWLSKDFEPPFWNKVKLVFGGHRWRCEYCRVNFVSLRKRKEVFSFKRWEKFQAPAEGRGGPPRDGP